MSTEQVAQSLSLLQTHQHLTLKSIMLELSISRSTARSILQVVASQCNDDYTIVRIGMSNGEVKLGTSTEGSVFSIVKSQEALQSAIAANEKSLSDQRDLSSTADGWNELMLVFADKEIMPAQEYLEGGAIRRVVRDRGVGMVTGAKPPSAVSSKSVKRGKETTAAAFFGKTAKKPAVKEVKGKENNQSVEPKEAPLKLKETAKETKPSKQSANVDDFVGDEDEDDEFLQQESERKARVAREARKEVRANVTDANSKKRNTSSLTERRKMNPDKGKEDVEMEEEKKDSDDEVECDDCVKKPMDAFAKRSSGGAGGAKKRRKKLVEKTVMENGYLKTVTEEVWEEYEEDEEAAPAKPASVKAAPKPAAKKSVGGKGKKQGSLMGFFSKK